MEAITELDPREPSLDVNNRDGSEVRSTHSINITPTENGYIVNVGCKVFVFECLDKMLDLIKRYLEDSHHIEDLYLQGTLF